MDPLRINAIHPMIHWIATSIIRTGGSEQDIPISEIKGMHSAGLLVPTAYRGFVHDDLPGYLEGIAPAPDSSEVLRIKHEAGKPDL